MAPIMRNQAKPWLGSANHSGCAWTTRESPTHITPQSQTPYPSRCRVSVSRLRRWWVRYRTVTQKHPAAFVSLPGRCIRSALRSAEWLLIAFLGGGHAIRKGLISVTWQDELQHLDAELAAGRISAEEYRQRRDALLSQGGGPNGPNSGGFAQPNTPSGGFAQPGTPSGGFAQQQDPFPPAFSWGE